MTSSGNLGMVCGVGRPMHERDDAHRIRQAEMAQEIAELLAENARLRAKLRAALGWNAPPALFFWLGRDADPATMETRR